MKNEQKKSFNYPYSAIHAVREWYKHNQNEFLTIQEIKELEPILVLDIYLEWEGIYGYASTITSILYAREEQ